jgi:diguanylate cyclase (GGDEF)-like protein
LSESEKSEALIESGKLLNECFSAFGEGRDLAMGFDQVLRQIGSFYAADGVHIFKIECATFSCVAEWYRPHMAKRIDAFQAIPNASIETIKKYLLEGRGYFFQGSRDPVDPAFSILKSLDEPNVKNLGSAPIFVEGTLYGFLTLENPSALCLDNLTDILLSVANILGSAIHDDKTSHLLAFDALTGLPTIEEADYLISERIKNVPPARRYILLKFDVQRFEFIDSFYGIHFGSFLIKKVARFLSTQCPNVLIVARVPNSDIFYALADDDPATLQATIKDFSLAFINENNNIAYGGVFGAYVVKDSSENFSSMDGKVSLAHSEAKKDLVGHFVLYDEKLEKRSVFEEMVLSTFEKALANHEFEVFIQPQYDMASDYFFGGEALCRWKKDGAFYMPNSFIPVLEKNGFIPLLDRYMLKETLLIIRRWIDHYNKVVPISLNLSRIDFYDENLLSELVDIIDRYHVPHEYIRFEVTESVYMEQMVRIIQFTEACRKIGIAVIMDDFGSGYSSLNALKDLDISMLKLDYGFLIATHNVDRRNAIITSVIDLCKRLSLPLVVEGVEKTEDVSFLRELGVRFIQGYYFGKPMPVADFEKLKLNFLAPQAPGRIDKGLLKAIFNPRSLINRFFDRSFVQYGIFRYQSGRLESILQNTELSHSSAFRALNTSGGLTDMMEAVHPTDRKLFREYLDSVVAKKPSLGYIFFRNVAGKECVNTKCRATLLDKKDSFSTLLLESFTVSSIDDTLPSERFMVTGEANYYFEAMAGAFFIISENKRILYMNEATKRRFPGAHLGGTCHELALFDQDCARCPFHNVNKPQCFYAKMINQFIDFSSVHVSYNGEPGYLVELCPTLLLGPLSEKGRMSRMNTAAQSLLNAYLEVDLKTGLYKKYEFGKLSLDMGDAGHIDQAIASMMERNFFDEETARRIKRYLSLKGLREAAKKGYSIRVRFKIGEADNNWIEDNMTFIKEARHAYACICIRDITEEVLRDYDSLTGLYNRSAGKAAIDDFFAENPKVRTVFAILDINHFKEINDTYGHPMGDQVLIGLAGIMKGLPKAYAFCTRLGGDEFVFLHKAIPFAYDFEKANAEFQAKFRAVGERLGLTVPTSIAIGVAVFPRDGLTFDSLYALADRDMYEKKKKAAEEVAGPEAGPQKNPLSA